ncbi:MAG: hypothetical protein IJU48_04205 [Synergistaceae bacterium]|nr:hypothetical protein [Synergistaceae bacterium]
MIFDDFESSAFNPENNYPEVSGFDENSELSNNEVETLIRDLLPAHHLDNCPSITCSPDHYMWDYYPDSVGLYNTDTSEILLSGAEEINEFGTTEIEVLLHEIGHNAYDSLLASDPQKIDDWANLHEESKDLFDATGLGFVSSYAQTDMFEDFAESYSEYVANPQLMQFLCPEKYDFMNQYVFDGREYDYILQPDNSYVLTLKDNAETINRAFLASGENGDIYASLNFEPVQDNFRCFTMIGSS